MPPLPAAPPFGAAVDLPLREPVAVFTVVLLVLLAAPLLGRVRVPSSVVLLAAGIALGPHALAVLDRDATIVLLGTVGLLYIMFLAGLEIDLHEFRRHRRQSLILGAATFAIPQGLGTAAGLLVLDMGGLAAVLLGSVFASHTLLAYPVVQRLGLTRTNAVTASIGATILTDTLALLVLAVVAGGAPSARGIDPFAALRLTAALAVLAGVVLWGLPRLAGWFFRAAATGPTADYVFVLAAVFACALATEAIGVEPLIGAFVAGLALNRVVPEGSALMNRTVFVGNALFIPFFLLATGMLVDPGAFTGSAQAWGVAGTMVAVVIVTKGAAAWLTRPAFGYSAAEARVVFGLTLPQAAATLAAVLVGYEVGLFGADVLNGTIAMVLVTCVVGPWMVERAGPLLAAEDEARRPDAGAPRPRLLVSLANPATVERIVDVALLLRAPADPEPLHVVTVVPGGADRVEHVARGERLLSKAAAHAAGAAVPVVPHVRAEHHVARALARAAAEHRASTLVLGWDGTAAAERTLFGSIPDRVLRESPALVLVVRSGARGPARPARVLLAVPPLAELEPGFADAVRLLKGMARRSGAAITLLTPSPYRDVVLRALERTGPRVPTTIPALPAWRALVPTLDRTLRPTDALVLLSARRGALSWRASLDRLPRLLGARFPDPMLLVAYAAQVPTSALLPAALTSGERLLLDRLTPAHVRLGLRPGPPEALYRQMVEGTLGTATVAAAVVAALAQAPPDASPELRPGAVLTHARVDALTEPALFVGVSAEGVALPQASAPVHAVFALLVPSHVPPRHALAWLALVARLVRDGRTVDRLRAAPTSEAARSALLAALRLPDDEAARPGTPA